MVRYTKYVNGLERLFGQPLIFKVNFIELLFGPLFESKAYGK